MQSTPTHILAEAIGEANVRAGPGLNYDLLGTIYNGTSYRVFGQHESFPWLLIEFPSAPGGRAWVFADLVSLNAPIEQVPYLTESIVVDTPTPSSGAGQPASTATATTQVWVEAQAEVNVRFGPGIDYPRIGRMTPGRRYAALSRHALYPWLLIDFPEAPDGAGWVYIEVLDIFGDIYSLPTITVEEVDWPTLTPTPPFVVTSVPPWQAASTPTASVTASSTIDVQALGESVLAYLLEAGFAPEAERFASVFLMDLASGENFSLGRDIAYSGMSLIKIPILVTFYRQSYRPPDAREAELIANTMICSGNHTANTLLTAIGGGDPLAGAEQVTATMQALGLHNTFIVAPFDLGEGTPVQYPVSTLRTEADQERAAPDPYNQTTPEDLGWLLGSIYQCAMHETGPLLEVFPDQITPTECRQIILAMSANQINVLTEAGVPVGTRVAHKHGWISDTHGDAAIIFTPGGDFVLTMAFFQPEWLPYEISWPAMAEITRLVYNAYNPGEALAAIHPATVDETCELQGNPLLAQLSAPFVPPIE